MKIDTKSEKGFIFIQMPTGLAYNWHAELADAILTDANFFNGISVLVDLRRSNVKYDSSKESGKLKQLEEAHQKMADCRIAILTGSKASFGTMRQMITITDEEKTPDRQVFYSTEEALNWLDISKDKRSLIKPALLPCL